MCSNSLLTKTCPVNKSNLQLAFANNSDQIFFSVTDIADGAGKSVNADASSSTSGSLD